MVIVQKRADWRGRRTSREHNQYWPLVKKHLRPLSKKQSFSPIIVAGSMRIGTGNILPCS